MLRAALFGLGLLLAPGLTFGTDAYAQNEETKAQLREQYETLQKRTAPCREALIVRKLEKLVDYFFYTTDSKDRLSVALGSKLLPLEELFPQFFTSSNADTNEDFVFRGAFLGRAFASFWPPLRLLNEFELRRADSNDLHSYRFDWPPFNRAKSFKLPIKITLLENITGLPPLSASSAVLEWMDWDIGGIASSLKIPDPEKFQQFLDARPTWEEFSKMAARPDIAASRQTPNPAAVHALVFEIEIQEGMKPFLAQLKAKMDAMTSHLRERQADPQFGYGFLQSSRAVKFAFFSSYDVWDNFAMVRALFDIHTLSEADQRLFESQNP